MANRRDKDKNIVNSRGEYVQDGRFRDELYELPPPETMQMDLTDEQYDVIVNRIGLAAISEFIGSDTIESIIRTRRRRVPIDDLDVYWNTDEDFKGMQRNKKKVILTVAYYLALNTVDAQIEKARQEILQDFEKQAHELVAARKRIKALEKNAGRNRTELNG